MKTVLEKANNVAHVPMRRALTYAACLALNQNDPKFCIELLSECKQQNYVTVRNLKSVAFAKLNRLDDALAILRAALEYDRPNIEVRKRSFFKDVVSKFTITLSFLDFVQYLNLSCIGSGRLNHSNCNGICQ